MKNSILICLLLVSQIVIPTITYGQYFQGLYDIDTSQDWGGDIFINPDGSYFIFGTSAVPAIQHWLLFNNTVKSDGSSIINQNLLYSYNFNLYQGYPGSIKMLPNGGYISPFTAQNYFLTDSWVGIIKYDENGNTVFMKSYTDTPIFFDRMFACAIMPDGGYIAGGQHGLRTVSYHSGFLIRTDSFGDSIWTHTYQKNSHQFAQINTIIPLSDGRIVVGAISTFEKNPGPNSYYYNTPWYMLLDSIGNIIRDTLYTTGFQNGGLIYPDLNGGYICIGNIDTMYSPDPNDFRNFPSYISHLDTNFRMTWLTQLPYSPDIGNRQICLAKQLHDSSYIVIGDMWPDPVGYLGCAVKINRNGNILWSHSYQSDAIFDSHFRAMVEKPDGNLVFVGTSFNDTLPRWRQIQDVWLVGTDSNGCENGLCAPTAVPLVEPPGSSFSLFPNPSTGAFSLNCIQSGVVIIYNMQGQQVAEYKVMPGENTVRLPIGLAAGVYMVQYMGEAGSAPVVVRLVYEQ